ncbi:MAG: GIY-YIG nuclease family protein [Dehalococcoidales bacterium]|nr:GIY-YIG nuclease family protein [Dehalococcoidales bacterium]
MDKDYILKEIDRTAKANNGIPLGRLKFEKETGIRYWDWWGKHWTRWNDALAEAGYPPNTLQLAYDEEALIEQIISLIREIGKFPTVGELRMKAHNSKGFPAHNTIHSRLGRQSELPKRILAYCADNPEYSDVADICKKAVSISGASTEQFPKDSDIEFGYVYLMKSGRFYKIGNSKNVERRNYEIGIKLPEDLTVLHKIRTDDPVGIENYWHNRFKDRRRQGEWFDLSIKDVSAFKRRKFM